MSTRLILDLGSHSAKAYLRGDSLQQVGNITWQLLEDKKPQSQIERSLRELVEQHVLGSREIVAIGTEVMRRDANLAMHVRGVCEKLGISYRTLSQQEEAELILAAYSDSELADIVNVGGGSIQVISGKTREMALLGFGISDLNSEFNLAGLPGERRVRECVDWVTARLPAFLGPFIYAGGEETYLRRMGVPMTQHMCLRADFDKMATRIAQLCLEELENLSPFDPRWMRGAVASNCIVQACFDRSGTDSFKPSDLNIAHGLLSALN